MGLRDRLFRLLSQGEVDVPNPDAEVELAEVMLHEGPLLVAALEQAGVWARGVETWNAVTKTTSRMQIVVRAVDRNRAMDVVRESGVRLTRPLY